MDEFTSVCLVTPTAIFLLFWKRLPEVADATTVAGLPLKVDGQCRLEGLGFSFILEEEKMSSMTAQRHWGKTDK